MGRISENEKQQNRYAIIEAAKELFIQYGVSKTTVEDITKKAIISKGAFYSYFESKEHLFIEIIKTMVEKIGSTQTTAFQNYLNNSTKPDGFEILMQLSKIRYSFIESEPLFKLLIDPEFENERQLIQRKYPKSAEEVRDLTNLDKSVEFIRRLQQNGLIKDEDPRLIASQFHAVFILYINKSEFEPIYFKPIFNKFREFIFRDVTIIK